MMVRTYWQVAAVCICATCATIVVPAFSSEPNAAARHAADWHWNAMREAYAARPVPEGLQRDEVQRWLIDVLEDAGGVFWRLAREPLLQVKLEQFVGHFGQHGPEADLVWLLASPEMILANDVFTPVPLIGDAADVPPEVLWSGRVQRRVQMMVAEAQVRRFLKEPAIFERYCHAVMWSRLLLRDGDHTGSLEVMIIRVMGDWDDAPDDAYWWHARHFMVAAYLTGRSDLLADADPAALKATRDVWWRWLQDNVERLAAHPTQPRWQPVEEHRNLDGLPALRLPATPFPDGPLNEPEMALVGELLPAVLPHLLLPIPQREVQEAGLVLRLHEALRDRP